MTLNPAQFQTRTVGGNGPSALAEPGKHLGMALAMTQQKPSRVPPAPQTASRVNEAWGQIARARAL